MFFQSKLFKFLLPLLAYLLFAFQLIYNYAMVWYDNIPEQTQYLRHKSMGFYMGFVYLFVLTFFIFLVSGIIYLIKTPASKFINYLLIADLFLSAYNVWLHSTSLKSWNSSVTISFFILVLFAYSIFLLSKVDQIKKAQDL